MSDVPNNFLLHGEPQVDFSIVIPVYNSEQSLPLVLDGVRQVFAELNLSYEFVLADDASQDNSWAVIQEEYKKNDITAISFLKNQGHSVALKRALEFCRGNWVITMDDDLQHPPSELPKLINAAMENPDVDVVMGAYNQQRSQVHKSLGSRLYQYVLQVSYPIAKRLTITSFRVMHRRIVDEIVSKRMSSPHAGFIILGSTNRIINVPVEYHDRQFGTSGMSLSRSVKTLFDGLFMNSELPLKVIGFGGLIMSSLAVMLGLIYLIKYLLGSIGISGFTTLVLLIIGFSGILLTSMSVVGLYVARILQQVNFTPEYSLRGYLPPKTMAPANNEKAFLSKTPQ